MLKNLKTVRLALCISRNPSHIRANGDATGGTTMQTDTSHPIHVVPHPARMRILWNGLVVADTTEAVTLYEASYSGVRYVPRTDVDMTLLTKSSLRTHCPYKGDASYFSLQSDGATAKNAIWSYETPRPAARNIAGYLAFDPEQVEFVENNVA
jgi:uncharacterized protein (DUF427 family)